MNIELNSTLVRRSLLVRAGLLVVAGSILGLALFFVAQNSPTDNDYYPKCLLYKFTSIHCPGCGSTRALHSLLNWRVEQAFAYNAVMVVLFPFGLVLLLRSTCHRVWKTKPGRLPGHVWFPRIIAIAFVVFFILRNIPVYPLTLLAPHELTP